MSEPMEEIAKRDAGRKRMSEQQSTPRLLVEQVREMLRREAYHYCADCKAHCRQLILTIEALKELEHEFKVIDGKRVADSCASHGPNIAVFYIDAECPPDAFALKRRR